MTFGEYIKPLRKKVSFYFVVFFFIFAVPVTSLHAGIFSFLGTIFEKKDTVVATFEGKTINSQNVALLQAALNIDPNPSKGGGDITIVGGSALLPDVGPLGTLADVEGSETSDQISIYVVREGDSLSQIAKMFSVSVNTIIWANDIKRGNIIHEGQTLIILPITGVQYTVKKGDTLASIAKKYKGDIEEIEQYNNIQASDTLTVGSIVVIPDGEFGTPTYSSSRQVVRVRGAGGPSYSGYYIRPAQGPRTQKLHGFNGIDIGGSYGAPIVASASGNAIIARSHGWNGGYGKYIVIAHENGTQTLYSHLSSIIVSQGSRVVQGQVIGYIGSTGRSTGPHLHFEVRGAQNPF